jgi:hypothetical protein
VSDACIGGKMGEQDCVNRFLLKGWELSEDKCQEVCPSLPLSLSPSLPLSHRLALRV